MGEIFLRKRSIAHLDESEVELGGLEDVLDAEAYLRPPAVLVADDRVADPFGTASAADLVLVLRGMLDQHLGLSLIGLIAPTSVSSPCSSAGSIFESAMLAGVAAIECTHLVSASTPA